jgi:hypothetical protein
VQNIGESYVNVSQDDALETIESVELHADH